MEYQTQMATEVQQWATRLNAQVHGVRAAGQ